MALPTVHYDRIAAATNSSLHSETMPKLHALLVAAGWTVEFINSDAIGTGTSGSPAWDKTPAVSTSCGIAIYSMPLNDHSRAWFVKLEPGWGSSVTNGVQHEGHGRYGRVGGNADGRRQRVRLPWAQRLRPATKSSWPPARTGSRTTTRAPPSAASAGSTSSACGSSTAPSPPTSACSAVRPSGRSPIRLPYYGCVAYRASDGYEYATNGWMLLARVPPTLHSNSATVSTTSADGETGIPIGPVNTSARAWGIPRLILIVGQLDAVANSDHPVLVDGGTKPLPRSP
jgi:hypothetical protein